MRVFWLFRNESDQAKWRAPGRVEMATGDKCPLRLVADLINKLKQERAGRAKEFLLRNQNSKLAFTQSGWAETSGWRI